MVKVNHMTAEGMEKLRSDLDQLRAQRPHISAQIAEARDKGDLSENAEYDAAKEAQGLLEMRIAKLEHVVSISRIIDASKIDVKQIQILNRIKIKNTGTGKVFEYQIVSESEANIKDGKLSIATPIAQALLGKKLGAVVDVTVPSGKMQFEVLEISI